MVSLFELRAWLALRNSALGGFAEDEVLSCWHMVDRLAWPSNHVVCHIGLLPAQTQILFEVHEQYRVWALRVLATRDENNRAGSDEPPARR